MKGKKFLTVLAVAILFLSALGVFAMSSTLEDERFDGFETGAPATFWNYKENDGYTITSDISFVHSGTYGLKQTGGGMSYFELLGENISSTTYAMECFMKINTTGGGDADSLKIFKFQSSNNSQYLYSEIYAKYNSTGWYIQELCYYHSPWFVATHVSIDYPLTLSAWHNVSFLMAFDGATLFYNFYCDDNLALNYTIPNTILDYLAPSVVYISFIGWGNTLAYDDIQEKVGETEPAPTPLPTPSQNPLTPGTSVQYFFRSDLYQTSGVSGYGLDADYTNIHVNITISTIPCWLGFRVWLVSPGAIETEITNSTPIAQFYLNGTFPYSDYSSSWDCPGSIVNLGYDALEIKLYAMVDEETWSALVSFISPVLITKEITASTWYFTLVIASGSAVISFGDYAHRSGVSGIVFTVPLESEVQLWRITNADYVGFILGNYIDVIGEAFYVLCLLGIAGVFYFRYKHFGIIVFFFSIFGGSGGLVWFLLPAWAATVASALIIIGTSFLVWRLIR